MTRKQIQSWKSSPQKKSLTSSCIHLWYFCICLLKTYLFKDHFLSLKTKLPKSWGLEGLELPEVNQVEIHCFLARFRFVTDDLKMFCHSWNYFGAISVRIRYWMEWNMYSTIIIYRAITKDMFQWGNISSKSAPSEWGSPNTTWLRLRLASIAHTGRVSQDQGTEFWGELQEAVCRSFAFVDFFVWDSARAKWQKE